MSCVSPEDCVVESQALPNCTLLTQAKGLCAQLNQALEHCADEGIVLVCDDDVELAPTFLEILDQIFLINPDVVGAGGAILYDSAVTCRPISREEAIKLVADSALRKNAKGRFEAGAHGDADVLYGCNMVFRAAPLKRERFDDNLPLYSLYFEADICRRMAKHGRVVNCPEAKVVHLASVGKRMSGVKMGYSQIANPYYLWKMKRTVTTTELLRLIPQALLANAVKSLKTSDSVDRRGRLKGNLKAIKDLISGSSYPGRIVSM